MNHYIATVTQYHLTPEQRERFATACGLAADGYWQEQSESLKELVRLLRGLPTRPPAPDVGYPPSENTNENQRE